MQDFLKATIGAGCILLHEQQILLVQVNYGPAKGHWILPGGYVEAGENPDETALRETFEETGLQVENPILHAVRYRKNPADVYWVYRVNCAQIKPIQFDKTELLDAKFWPLTQALQAEEVRPMTRFFLQALTCNDRNELKLPTELAENNVVYFRGTDILVRLNV